MDLNGFPLRTETYYDFLSGVRVGTMHNCFFISSLILLYNSDGRKRLAKSTHQWHLL